MRLPNMFRLVLLSVLLLSALPLLAGQGTLAQPAMAAGPDLALGRPATASSTGDPSHPAASATDGSTASYWQSAGAGSQWLAVDLGATATVTQVTVDWGPHYATSYYVEFSTDGAAFRPMWTVAAGGPSKTVNVAGQARYVRVRATQSAASDYQLAELQVFGTLSGAASPTPAATPTGQPQPVRGQLCPQWYHDAITTTGPDGKQYPTWHPAVDPATGCYFGHDHGDDPRTSLANSSMPAFGYVGAVAGDDEPHAGFKVFVQNHGSVNDDGRTLAQDARMVFHQGTGGVKRFDARFHSLEYDFKEVGGSGHELHVKGMADTGAVGSICAAPRQGRTVVLLPGAGCPITSRYEIWAVTLNVGGKATVNASFGVFDPITVMDPANHTRLLYTTTYYPQFGPAYGCAREAYSGPNYFSNPSGPTTFTTDAMGNPGGPVVQYVSQHDDLGVGNHMTTDNTQSQAKLGSYRCAPGLTLAN